MIHTEATLIRIARLRKMGISLRPIFVEKKIALLPIEQMKNRDSYKRALDAALNAHKISYKIRKFIKRWANKLRGR